MSRSEIDAIFDARPKKKSKCSLAPRQPETIQDLSKKKSSQKRRREKIQQTKIEIDHFKDSRGSISRRKTADGYNIYKEDELGLSTSTTGGGDHWQLVQHPPRLLNPFLVQTPPFVPLIVNAVSELYYYTNVSMRILVSAVVNKSELPTRPVRPGRGIHSLARLYRSLADPALVAMVCEVNV